MSPSAAPACPTIEEPLEGNYFVSTYPPFSCWNEAGAAAFRRRLGAENSPGEPVPLGLYLHLPFCLERCQYCYYLSYDDRSAEVDRYLDGLVRELTLYASMPAIAGRRPDFVYFGGGTPSVLSTQRLRRLFGRLRETLPWADAAEVTFECAPKSVTSGKLAELRRAGVTRISMGVQALDDAVLAQNGRVHLVRDVERAWRAIRDASFPTANLDLIVGLLGETDDSFSSGLERALGLEPPSITIYQLEIPRNTPLYRALRDGELATPPAGWEVKRARLLRAFERLERAGYVLRSAYTAVRDPRVDRFRYQDEQYRGADLLGLGASAFSHFGGANHQNLAALDRYLDALGRGELPLWRGYELGREERVVRELVLQLKLGRVETEPFRLRFDVDLVERFRETFARLAGSGLLRVSSEAVELTRPGLLRADRVVREFFLPQHRGIRYS